MNPKDVDYLPEGTKCCDCVYMITRIIEPLDDGEVYEVFVQEDEESSIFIHTACLLLDVDLHDHIVKECSKYEKIDPNLLISDRFLLNIR